MHSAKWVVLAMMVMVGSSHSAGFGVTGKAGSLGIGVEGTVDLIPHVNLRGGVNFFNYDTDSQRGDIDYNLELKLKSFSALIDLHPIPGSGLRFTGGLIWNGNDADLVANPTENYDIGGQTYTATNVGNLTANLDFNTTAPYAGIGWGNAATGRIGFAFDLGLAFQGSPAVNLDATGALRNDPLFVQDLQREETQLQDDVDGFKYYPVISIGLSLKLTP